MRNFSYLVFLLLALFRDPAALAAMTFNGENGFILEGDGIGNRSWK